MAELFPLDGYLYGEVTTMEVWERLHHDHPATPIPESIAVELARMDERERAWLTGQKVHRNAEHYLAERGVGLTELGCAPLFQRHADIIERRQVWRRSKKT